MPQTFEEKIDALASLADAFTEVKLTFPLGDENIEVGELIGWATRELTRREANKEKE